jgi:hypothetical protein
VEISIIDEVETTKGLISDSTIEASLLKNKILFALERAKEYVEKTNWTEIGMVDGKGVERPGGYLVRIRLIGLTQKKD